jgi:hypothetical protein
MKIHCSTFLRRALICTSALMMLFCPGVKANGDGEDESAVARAKDYLGNSNFVFIKNMGQYDDLVTDRKILYCALDKGVTVWITDKGITYILSYTPDRISEEEESAMDRSKPVMTSYHRVDMEFIGGEISPGTVIEEEKEETYYNFYYPSHPEGILNVPLFRKITFQSIYKGIDWVIYCNGEQGLKFDFVIHPGADASRIMYQYLGAQEIKKDIDQKSILIGTSMGTIAEGKLVSYYQDDKTEVQSVFKLEGNKVSIKLPENVSTRILVIDPPLVWGTYNGDAGNQGVLDGVTDNSGNFYACGYTNGNIFPTTGAWQGAIAGNYDACMFKFDAWGRKIWATFYGGQGSEIARDLVYVSLTNSIAIVGNTGSTNFPVTIGTYAGGTYWGNGLGGDGYYLRFNVNGVRIYATFFGGSNDDELRAISTNSTGRTYIVGTSRSTNFPVTANGAQLVNGGAVGTEDAVILAIAPGDALLYSSYHGGNGADEGLCIDANDAYSPGIGRVYIGGYTTGGTFPILNATLLQSVYGGGTSDGFIARYDLIAPTPGRKWSSFYGGPVTTPGTGADKVKVIDAVTTHAIYFAQETSSTTYPICNALYNYKGGLDVYYSRLVDITTSPFQDLAVCAYFGSSANESPWDIAHDPDGSVYLVGETNGNNFYPIQALGIACNYNQAAYGGGIGDGFIMKLSDCTVSWATYYGGTGWDWIMGACVSPSSCLYIMGEQHSTVLGVPTELFNPGDNAYYQGTSGLNHEQMFTKFCDCPIANAGPDITTNCVAGGVQLAVGITPVPCYTYQWNPTTNLTGSNTANPTCTFIGTITYTLTVTNPGNCGIVSTDQMTFTGSNGGCRLGHFDTLVSVPYTTYPNPTRDEFNISFNTAQSKIKIELYDAMGRKLLETELSNSDHASVSLKGRATGIYFVRFELDGQVYIERVIKED